MKETKHSKFAAMRFSRKVSLLVALLVLLSNLVILGTVCFVTVRNVQKETTRQLQGQLGIVLSTVSSTVDDITDSMCSLSSSDTLVSFATCQDVGTADYLNVVNEGNEALHYLKGSNSMIDCVALLRTDSSQYLYFGNTIPSVNIRTILCDSYQTSVRLQQMVSGSLLLDVYSHPELLLFCPVYRLYDVNPEPVGILVVAVNLDTMRDYLLSDDSDFDIRLLSSFGEITVAQNAEEIGTEAEYFSAYSEEQGTLMNSSGVICYQKDEGGIWAADITVPRSEFYSGIIRSAAVVAVMILAFTAAAIVALTLLFRRLYTPLGEMTEAMRKVRHGDLDAVMPECPEEDLQQLSSGFNRMTVSIKGLIAAVRQREKENTEIRLNALQSQIKPHFLYNTLECIHWQALMSNAPEVASTILSLSKYYRLCLSKGADIVPLSQEMAHTASYVDIQNFRFDNIIAVKWEIPAELENAEIPKITLQPLVENALVHGIRAEDDRKGTVVVSASAEGETLVITVADDGIGMEQSALDHLNDTLGEMVNDGSYGVKNVHKRLEIRYGDHSGLHYDRNESGGITVTIRLPLRQWKADPTVFHKEED